MQLSFESAIMKAEDAKEMYELIMALTFYQNHFTGYLEGLEGFSDYPVTG